MDIFSIIIEILRSDAGSSTFVVLLFIGIAYLIWKTSHYNTKFSEIDKVDEKFDKIENKFDNKFTQMEEKIEKKFDRAESKFDEIKDSLSVIKAFIENQKDKTNPFAQRQSPVKLTPKGIEVEKEIQAEALIDKYWDYISREVNERLQNNCNPYDIQVASFEVGDMYQQFISNEELDKIKINAYNHGYNLDVYELLFGIIIRDRILKDRNIDPYEVDKHDPNINV